MNGPSIQQAFDLALAQQRGGKLAAAIASYHDLLRASPDNLPVMVNLGVALKDSGALDEAIANLQRAVALFPGAVQAWSGLGVAWKFKGNLDRAIDALEKARSLDASSLIPLNNLALAYQDAGRLDDAIGCLERALEIDPKHQLIDSNRVYMMHFHDRSDAESLYREHLTWAARHAAPLKHLIGDFENDRSLDRPLRIGYVSPNFREHVISRFLLPLLAKHDRARFQIYCYDARASEADAMSEKLRLNCDQWRDIGDQSDEQAAQLIREDRIDILVDLAMHMAHNRLLVFARKPAPVQVTYLAYCSTTGLDTIDYRLTDPYLDPPGREEKIYSERSIHLAGGYWCYWPLGEAAEPNPSPAEALGHVTFGCLNNFGKVTPGTLAVWCELLRLVPGSRLLLHAHEGKHRQRVFDLFAEKGVDPSRLSFVGFQPLEKYMELYGRIDIALDTFPYAGGTTTCDALWMGVPVVTLTGRTAVGRGGVSILSTIGLPELIAASPDEYVRIAAGLANDLPRLRGLRQTLRDRMRQSPLMDADRFARNMESAFRAMWENWCKTKK